MLASDFDYHLPPDQIAQEPAADRTAARLLALDRRGGALRHHRVSDLPELLRAGDLLVLNDTKVFSARIFGRWKDTGGNCEVLLIEPGVPEGVWLAFCRSSRPVRAGQHLIFGDGELRAEVLGSDAEGRVTLRLEIKGDLFEMLEDLGTVPLPPYIRRRAGDGRAPLDRERYQTVYASRRGAVAAPTAGLHFTESLLAELAERGVEHARLTLHVGPGTFKPVKCENIEDHLMDSERFEISEEAAARIEAARASGGRIVAVGSTSVRALETVAERNEGRIIPCEGRSRLFIHPPYEFRVVDAMLTNFHLPRSTLLMMVSALAGRERVLAAYEEAVRAGYRFYSYGDCMLISAWD
jgi:S-adenosylmethionine:tRNA ribosyltransferase-isomerase